MVRLRVRVMTLKLISIINERAAGNADAEEKKKKTRLYRLLKKLRHEVNIQNALIAICWWYTQQPTTGPSNSIKDV